MAELGAGIFLDLKFHDIPYTVAGAIAAALHLPGIRLINVHALGGTAMMQAAAEALASHKAAAATAVPKLIAVTALTSMDGPALRRVGIPGSPGEAVLKLAKLAKESGLDGVVASALDSTRVRKTFGKDFIIVNPGVRPKPQGVFKSSQQDDQLRIATPAEAIRAGADYIVVGRPITAAPDPRAAAEAILHEIETA